MSKEILSDDKKQIKRVEPADKAPGKERPAGHAPAAAVLNLQRQVGNQAVQRMLAQRSSEGAFDLDDDTASHINQSRGGGQPLDSAVQKQMSESMGHDFSGVRVHTSPEADALSQSLNAKAFTTGQDIFFKQGEYNPGASSGQELLAHELTHVVQQSSGQVSGNSGKMTVRPAGDVYEQEADATARQAVQAGQLSTGAEVAQRQEEEEELQMKRDDIQRQEEDELQMKADNSAQRQEAEEEELQMKRNDIQRQEEEEEEMQMKRDEPAHRQKTL